MHSHEFWALVEISSIAKLTVPLSNSDTSYDFNKRPEFVRMHTLYDYFMGQKVCEEMMSGPGQ